MLFSWSFFSSLCEYNISLPVEVASGNLLLLVALPNLFVGVLMWFCVYSHYKDLEEQGTHR